MAYRHGGCSSASHMGTLRQFLVIGSLMSLGLCYARYVILTICNPGGRIGATENSCVSTRCGVEKTDGIYQLVDFNPHFQGL